MLDFLNDAAIVLCDSGDDGADGEEENVHLHPDQTVVDSTFS